ncbi:O-acetylhomoserine aminocarboxypropyltransferase/cysteine synthase family protein [Plantibacter sp. YIM 135347]|uniref:O-acetylhomoserine aminocarboxypropyltransferase/cysteine synthase family protein n=1 Tax=Plantibacter sp. YIM 135347 TaxID=3423919 RepID=UPI003D34E25E
MTANEHAAAAWHFDTAQVHAGASPDPRTGARATPIFQTTSYVYESSQAASDIFTLQDLGSYSYTRTGNPTTSVAEQRIAELEGGRAAVAFASGQSATTFALLNLLRSGDHLVSSSHVYGGTTGLFVRRFAEIGITTTFVDDIHDPEAWAAAITPRTRAVFAESIGNPLGSVLDIRAVADVAHAAGVPLVIDNTLASPYLVRPLEHGADIVVHSTTKFLAGHGAAIGGAVVDSGTFDFGAEPEKWPGFTEPEQPGETRRFWQDFGEEGIAYSLRLRANLLRDYGAAPSPFNSFLLILGIETLSLRMRQHVANAETIAAHLLTHPSVEAVHYAGLPTSPEADRVAQYLPKGAGSIVSFEIRGGSAAGSAFVESLDLFSHLANIGDVRSLVIHPASTTHSQLSEAEQRRSGISPSLIRLSIGIEDARDLITDLDAAFDRVNAIAASSSHHPQQS